MQLIRNFLNTHGSGRQKHFCSVNSRFPDICIDGHSHFCLEFPCQIVFRVSHLTCQLFQRDFPIGMGIDIITANAYRAGHTGLPPHLIDPADKVLIHGMTDRRHLAERLGSVYALGIGIA